MRLGINRASRFCHCGVVESQQASERCRYSLQMFVLYLFIVFFVGGGGCLPLQDVEQASFLDGSNATDLGGSGHAT